MGEIRNNYTPQEQKNIELVKEYMQIAYDPKRASAEAVGYLCASNNRFIAPTTFSNVHTLEEYAQDHGEIMKQVNDLHFVSFDVLFAKEDRVCLRYTAEGSHSGESHGNINATGKKAQWTATRPVLKLESKYTQGFETKPCRFSVNVIIRV